MISNVVSALFHVDRRDEPADPAESGLALTLVATARKEADEEPSSRPGFRRPTAWSPRMRTSYPIPTDVEVIPWTPPLEWLQRVPVLGRFVVTPTRRAPARDPARRRLPASDHRLPDRPRRAAGHPAGPQLHREVVRRDRDLRQLHAGGGLGGRRQRTDDPGRARAWGCRVRRRSI